MGKPGNSKNVPAAVNNNNQERLNAMVDERIAESKAFSTKENESRFVNDDLMDESRRYDDYWQNDNISSSGRARAKRIRNAYDDTARSVRRTVESYDEKRIQLEGDFHKAISNNDISAAQTALDAMRANNEEFKALDFMQMVRDELPKNIKNNGARLTKNDHVPFWFNSVKMRK